MRVYNKSSRKYQHSEFNKDNKLVTIELLPKTDAEIPDEIAKKWLKTGEVVEYVKPEDAKAKQAELEEEIAKLKAENEKLKASQAKEDEPEDGEPKDGETLEALKEEATKLGIQFAPNIGADTLKARIEAKKAEQN